MLRIGQKFSSGGRVTIRMALVGVVMSAGLLAGCAGRPGADALDVVSTTVPGASEHVILVASSRARDPKPGVFYNGERTPALSFAKVDITVPPTHKPGMTEIPRGQPNPATDMTVREAIYRDTPQEFTNDLKAQLALRPKGEKTVFLFVHGYNTLFSEALYRFTQMAEDSKSTAVPVMFTWASRGSVADYVYDNNSATSARDRLEETINLIFDSGAERVSIMAHSMGNWVTVEALRQIQISGRGLPKDRIGNIILAAPDIDVDVFKSQLRRFGKPAKPFIVIVSRDDKALAFSDFIAGDKPRLGAFTNDAELVELGAVVVDMTNVKSTDGFNHSKFAQLAELAPELRGVMARARPEASQEELMKKLGLSGIHFAGADTSQLRSVAGASLPTRSAATPGASVVPPPEAAAAEDVADKAAAAGALTP